MKISASTDGTTWFEIHQARSDFAYDLSGQLHAPNVAQPVYAITTASTVRFRLHMTRRQHWRLCRELGGVWGQRRAKRRARKREGKR